MILGVWYPCQKSIGQEVLIYMGTNFTLSDPSTPSDEFNHHETTNGCGSIKGCPKNPIDKRDNEQNMRCRVSRGFPFDPLPNESAEVQKQ